MKAIYTKLGDTYYRIRQDTTVPKVLIAPSYGNSASTSINRPERDITETIVIDGLAKQSVDSNAEMYRRFEQELRDKQVTRIQEIQNYFKVYIDYAVFQGQEEIDHAVVIKRVTPIDKARILGVAMNNECVYRRVKAFQHNVSFKFHNTMPHGIMCQAANDYTIVIHDIALFQDFATPEEIHPSVYDVSYRAGSVTIPAEFENMMMVYSTRQEGMEITPIHLPFIPRTMTLALTMLLDNFIVVYNDAEVDAILKENEAVKEPPVNEPDGIVVPPCNCPCCKPDEEPDDVVEPVVPPEEKEPEEGTDNKETEGTVQP